MAVNLFNPSFYKAVNQDLQNLTDGQAFQHFINFGANENRLFSPIVDLDWYRQANPGLAQAGLTTNRQLFEHLSNFGVAEGRQFSFNFHPTFYRNSNADLAAAGLNNEQLFEHFRNFGINEGRPAAVTFSPNFYLASNQDLQQAGFNFQDALEHFRLSGLAEGRASSPNFNARFYLSSNPDLEQAFGFDFRDAFEHFLLLGNQEGRIASPGGPIPPPILPPPPPATEDPGNTPATAFELGTISETRTVNEAIGNADVTDYYRFNLSNPTNLSVVLNGLTQDADLEVFFDSNSNGVLEATERIGISEEEGTLQDEVTGFFTQGNYFVQVFQGVPGAETAYNLNLISSPATGDLGGNTPGDALILGNLTGNRTIDDFVGDSDPQDYFNFVLDNTRNVNLLLTNLSDDAELILYEDMNNNGAIEDGELVTQSVESGTTPELISRSLDAGSYFVLVDRAFAGVNANYTLSLSA